MREDHIFFRMLCFQVSQERFMVSAENFMKVLFLTCDVFCSYEHDREHVAACESIPQSIQPKGGLQLSPGPLHVCVGLPIHNVDQFAKSTDIVATMHRNAIPPRHRGMLLRKSPSLHSALQCNPHLHVSLWRLHHHV